MNYVVISDDSYKEVCDKLGEPDSTKHANINIAGVSEELIWKNKSIVLASKPEMEIISSEHFNEIQLANNMIDDKGKNKDEYEHYYHRREIIANFWDYVKASELDKQILNSKLRKFKSLTSKIFKEFLQKERIDSNIIVGTIGKEDMYLSVVAAVNELRNGTAEHIAMSGSIPSCSKCGTPEYIIDPRSLTKSTDSYIIDDLGYCKICELKHVCEQDKL